MHIQYIAHIIGARINRRRFHFMNVVDWCYLHTNEDNVKI